MKKRSHYRLFIPEYLGYDEDNRLAVPPSSTLIYDIEVIDAIEEEASVVEVRKQMSYSYDLSGQEFEVRGGFNIHEKDRSQFLQGFNAGFEAEAQEVSEMRQLLEARNYGLRPIVNIKSAKKIAFSFGVCAASDLMEGTDASVADFDFKILSQAYSDAIEGKDSPFSEEEMENFIYAYFLPKEQVKQLEIQAKKEAEEAKKEEMLAIAAAANIAVGAKFMEKNQKKEGVVTMANGLQYLILEEGAKDTIRAGEKDNVKVHIYGTLIDGTVIYNTREDNKPMAMNLGAIIKGLATGIPLMPIGGKYRFFIPPNLVFGNEGSTFMAGGATLILEVELMEIN
jgi:FKBP-type peptidyl-prolyl cis-trans isomerase